MAQTRRYHFHGPIALHQRAEVLARRRSASGTRCTTTDVLRQALALGIDQLEAGASHAPQEPSLLRELVDTVDDLNQRLSSLEDYGPLRALEELDVDALQAINSLDAGVIEALNLLDTNVIEALSLLDADALGRLSDL